VFRCTSTPSSGEHAEHLKVHTPRTRDSCEVFYIILFYFCLRVGGNTCYNKYVHGVDNFKFVPTLLKC
jgi:hypothetical protein